MNLVSWLLGLPVNLQVTKYRKKKNAKRKTIT